MKKTFSIAAVALALISGGYPIQQVETTYKTVEVGPATVEIERTGPQITMQVEGIPEDGELTVSRGSTQISETPEGVFEDRLPENRVAGLYTFSLESPIKKESVLVSSGKIAVEHLADYVNLDVVTTQVELTTYGSQSALAATTLPTRTRFRYQTFIPDQYAPAPAPACSSLSTSSVLVSAKFLGDNRSWNPDSESFKTRTDVVVDWAAGGVMTPEFSVGETTRIVDYLFLPPLQGSLTESTKKTASSENLKLVKGAMSSDFVSFRITSDVTNPLCIDWMTKGIHYEFAFYVHREGTFVVHGTMLRVPNHELYSRNNANSAWRTLFQVTNQGFQCLFEYSWGCDLDKSVSGDLVP